MDLAKLDLKSLASFIYEVLHKNNIEAVLVGGACVSIYSHNQYQSYDLDFVVYESIKEIDSALKKFGFTRKGRCFYHKSTPFIIDFVNPPVAIASKPVNKFEVIKTRKGLLKLLTPIDCVKDRLSAYFFWNDFQSLEQAVLVAKKSKVNLNNIKRWATEENNLEKFNVFLEKLKL